MPAPYAHFKISDEALDLFCRNPNVSDALRDIAREFSNYVHLGSVAPDYPYFDADDREQKIWADHMHYDQTGDILKSMAACLRELAEKGYDWEEFKIIFSWILGYLSHVTADLVVHPVVASCVGSYAGHESDHKECEMVQDSYIYHKLTGTEIKDSRIIEALRNHSAPDDEDFDPAVAIFWEELLRKYFRGDFLHKETYPQIDGWHRFYTSILKESGGIQLFARAFGLTYKVPSDIIGYKMAHYVRDLHYPDGTTCHYDDVFDIAVNHVAEQWALLSQEIATGDLDFFSNKIVNYNLDTGFKMTELAFWPNQPEA